MAVWQKYEKKRNFILVGCKNILIFAKSYAVSPAPSTACGERLFGIFTSQRLGIAPILFFLQAFKTQVSFTFLFIGYVFLYLFHSLHPASCIGNTHVRCRLWS